MNEPPEKPVKYITTDMYLPHNAVAGDYRAMYLRALKDKTILGSKCSASGKVFVPPVMSSPETMAPAGEVVKVADKGSVTTFCIVNIPIYGRDLKIPYVCASVLLDGSDFPIFALIQEVDVTRVCMGMRVEAVWRADGERRGDHTDIVHFRPSSE